MKTRHSLRAAVVLILLASNSIFAAVTTTTITEVEKIIGLTFTPEQRNQIVQLLNDNSYWGNRTAFERMRKYPLLNSDPPAMVFNPIPLGFEFETDQNPIFWSAPIHTTRPANIADLAFYSVRDLGELIWTRQITSLELTTFYLERLKQYDPQLFCVVTLTEDLALSQAARADAELAVGVYRGPLHGIPYGIKDVFATKTYPTTWGAAPYRDRVIDEDAFVVQKLEQAGAVLVAKLALGALAQGDVWFGGRTRNPWNLSQGSGGSSAGPAAATAAGLVPFAVGTETLGSIIQPCTRCRVTGLRPTFGRISRTGSMTMSWSMDKIGPICRSVEDCAIVFEAIRGPDGIDESVIDPPFNHDPNLDLSVLRVGYRPGVSSTVRNQLAAIVGQSQLVSLSLPDYPYSDMCLIIDADPASAFSELTESGDDALLTAQGKWDWPNLLRTARTIPAAEYLKADRLRHKLIQEMGALMNTVDVWVAGGMENATLYITNLTGQPCVVIPHGGGTSISFIGRLYDEATILSLAKAYQDATSYHVDKPPLFVQ